MICRIESLRKRDSFLRKRTVPVWYLLVPEALEKKTSRFTKAPIFQTLSGKFQPQQIMQTLSA